MSALRPLVLSACGLAAMLAAGDVCAQGSKAENYSDKPPAALFNSDCTGSGCHSGPQGLARGKSAGDLTSYLREHYTNSRESAAALANYLAGVPGANNARTARPGRDIPAREPPAREEPKRDEGQSIFPSFPSLPFFSSPSSPPETAKRDETPPPPRARTGRRDEAAPSREAPARESSKRGPPAREEAKPDETQSIFPSFPFFSSPSSPPETAKRDEAPKPRARTGRRDETAPSSRPAAPKRDETAPQLPPTESRRDQATPRSRPSTSRRDEAAKPPGEGDRAKPSRARSRQPSNQIPNVGDPNTPNENEIYRPARPRQQPLTEDETKPAETTVTSVPANVPSSSTAAPPEPSALPTQAAQSAPPAQTPRASARRPAAESGSAPAEAAKPPRASQRQNETSAAARAVASPSSVSSASQSAAPAPPAPREQIFD